MKSLLFLVLGCFASLYCTAQVQLLDLSVTPLITNNNSGDSVQLLVQFKMSPVPQIQSIQFLFGTQTGQGDVFSGTAPVIQQGQEYVVSYGNQQILVKNYEAQIHCTLTLAQNNAWQKLSVFVTSSGGTQSGPLVWNKQISN